MKPITIWYSKKSAIYKDRIYFIKLIYFIEMANRLKRLNRGIIS